MSDEHEREDVEPRGDRGQRAARPDRVHERRHDHEDGPAGPAACGRSSPARRQAARARGRRRKKAIDRPPVATIAPRRDDRAGPGASTRPSASRRPRGSRGASGACGVDRQDARPGSPRRRTGSRMPRTGCGWTGDPGRGPSWRHRDCARRVWLPPHGCSTLHRGDGNRRDPSVQMSPTPASGPWPRGRCVSAAGDARGRASAIARLRTPNRGVARLGHRTATPSPRSTHPTRQERARRPRRGRPGRARGSARARRRGARPMSGGRARGPRARAHTRHLQRGAANRRLWAAPPVSTPARASSSAPSSGGQRCGIEHEPRPRRARHLEPVAEEAEARDVGRAADAVRDEHLRCGAIERPHLVDRRASRVGRAALAAAADEQAGAERAWSAAARRPGCAPPLRSSRSGRRRRRPPGRTWAPGRGSCGRPRASRRPREPCAAPSKIARERVARHVLGERRDGQREQHPAAHREHVGQGIRRRDLAERRGSSTSGGKKSSVPMTARSSRER